LPQHADSAPATATPNTTPEQAGQPERRDRRDRRQQPTSAFSRWWLVGRRRGGRRGVESDGIYVDRYRPGEWVLVLGILVLSIADMVLTLLYIQAGGEEANPIMAWALSHGRHAFAFAKMGITSMGIVVLLVHIRFTRVRRCVQAIFVAYCVLMLYHTLLRIDLPG